MLLLARSKSARLRENGCMRYKSMQNLAIIIAAGGTPVQYFDTGSRSRSNAMAGIIYGKFLCILKRLS